MDSMCSLVKPPEAFDMRGFCQSGGNLRFLGRKGKEGKRGGKGGVVSFSEGRLTDSALVVHGVVVGFIMGPAGLGEGLVLRLLDALAVSFGLWVLGFAGFGLVLGHGALLALLALLPGLAGLTGALFAGRLPTLRALLAAHGVLLLLLADILLAWVLGVLSVAVLVLLAVWIFALLLLAIALFVLLALTLVEARLAVFVLPGLLAVLLLLTVLGHSFGKLGLQEQVTS